MSDYVDDGWLSHNSRATITVHEEERSAKVIYHGQAGKKFAVKVTQKPNPIGFRARLPGDRK